MNQISKFLMFTLLQSCPILYLFCDRRDSQAIFSDLDIVPVWIKFSHFLQLYP